ncbi:MAG: DNA translocase FtsK 4TM domain-containing protein [Bacteroidales bacterium]|nr:DNA translocase FtsK 4TM domain-containing protein [Bacteroidales bacterium]
MAGKKIKTAKQKEKRFFSFFADMDPELKSILLKCAGVLVFLFTVFTFVAMFSYMFTWQPDKSLFSNPDMMHKSVEAHNMAGKLGYMWGRFLISGMFGLASYVFVFLFSVFSYRLFFWQRSIGLMRITFLSVSGAFLLSLGLSLIGSPRLLDGGLGGDAGHAVMSWMANLVGPIVPVLLLVAAVVVWLLFASGRFAHWFAITGEKKPVAQDEPAEQTDEAEDPEIIDVPQPQPEDIPAVVVDEVTVPVVEEDPVTVKEDEPVVVVEDVPVPDPEDQNLEVIRGDVVTEVVEDLPRIDNREELERFEFPPLDLLKDYTEGVHEVSQAELDKNNLLIRNTLKNYKIEVEKVTAVVGPTVTLYKIVLAPGMRVASIEQVHREIAMALEVGGVRVVTLPGSVGIEVPNSTPSIVPLKSMLNDDSFRNSSAELPVAIGYSTLAQKVKTFDLSDAPHLLVAGATKQGKSVGLNVIISSLLYAKHPSELKFVFIDPKAVEFTSYNSLLKHYLAVLPVAGDEEEEKKNAIVKKAKQAEQVLHSLCIEMDARYDLLAKAGVNDFKLYNEKYKDRHLLPTDGHQFLPYLVVVIDEYADLIMAGGSSPEDRKSAKNIEAYIIRLAQKGRAAGIHVIIATQRPSVNVITGLIKANFPTRIAFRVLSGVDSRTILDAVGAENLIGKGDMLYYAGVKVERIQCALVSMAEINKITKFIGDQGGYKQCYSTPYYLPVPESQEGEPGGGNIDMQNIDSMFEEAARTVVISQKGSTSDLQRKLGMGYARAGRVMDQLEAAGIVGPQEGSKPRQVLVATLDELAEVIEPFLNQ